MKTTGAPQARCARLVSRAGGPRCPLFARRPSPRTCLPSAPPGIPPGSFPRSILRRSKSAAGTGWPSVGRLRISRQRTARNIFHRSSAPSSPHTDPTATQVFHDHGGQSNKFLSKVGRLGRVAFSRRLNNGVSLPAAKHAALGTLPRHFISYANVILRTRLSTKRQNFRAPRHSMCTFEATLVCLLFAHQVLTAAAASTLYSAILWRACMLSSSILVCT